MNTYIQQGCIKLIKSDTKAFYIVAINKYIFDKCSCFEFSVHQRILKKMHHGYKKMYHMNIEQHNCEH